jgi:hypothetical protein
LTASEEADAGWVGITVALRLKVKISPATRINLFGHRHLTNFAFSTYATFATKFTFAHGEFYSC